MRNLKYLIFPFLYKSSLLKLSTQSRQDSYSKVYNNQKQYKVEPETIVFSGNSNTMLAKEVAQCLGIQLGKAMMQRFSDGECNIQVLDNVRGRNVFIIQSTCPPVNENLVELFLFISALRRASVKKITVILPYYGYSRQDHKLEKTQSIAAADIARMLEQTGIDHLVSIDLHRGQIQGAFSTNVPVDNISPYITLIHELNNNPLQLSPPNQLTLVSPDFNGVSRAKKVQDQLSIAFPNLKTSKNQLHPVAEAEISLVGEVNGRNCLIIDDIVDSGSTLSRAADILKREGAKSVMAYATHPVFSGRAALNLGISNLSKIYITDTIQVKELDKQILQDKLSVLSVAPLLAETIYRLQKRESLHELLGAHNI
ncbi:unnamed protein product (macronuclear) [Paramecium tetraurelia]|uniref:ribose-phosphate diphosphokinase n=1 Tax=Paramecium tetraurelia TaxID=5888 RepID=A0EDM2_PARTE|nr:uncharacterized protein GSPATT00025733001 [Paramecium tetraurelia]CAK93389.1 unnamed protein product [Paramecium tetraurelia]|eukprot:XP_001460786.1 hypothetical protein (macronuclear) [Paramecium tetraurelia strain d4-2]